MIKFKAYTDQFLKSISLEINDNMIFKNFFMNMGIIDIDDNNLVTIATTISKSGLNIIVNNYSEQITKVLNEIFEKECKFIFVLKEAITKEAKNKIKEISKSIKISNTVDIQKTFSNYVRCDYNESVYRFAEILINQDKNEFNPIFIFGDSGLGKTHLLFAISNELISKGLNVIYVNPSNFLRDIQFILQENNTTKLRELTSEFEKADIVMFDDFQSYGLGNKKVTLNIIFNILDFRINTKKTTIICSDRSVDSISSMFDNRIVTRLSMGLQLEIKHPTQTDLLKILNSFIDDSNLNPNLWEKEAKNYIVRNYSRSVRTLMGALSRIKFYKNDIIQKNSKYTLSVVDSILRDIQESKETITPETIIDYVAKYYKISKKDILGKGRQKEVVLARHIAIYLIRDQINIPLQQIGRFFGNRDHSTILNAIKKIEKESDNPDLSLRRTISAISDDLYRKK
ncbi:chromosomal replication initiator protein DnaA [Mycoplasmopsis maculosa]|nr:chromosomal replication initiator protein DnaA [Mycoplasmopsis maculosa]